VFGCDPRDRRERVAIRPRSTASWPAPSTGAAAAPLLQAPAATDDGSDGDAGGIDILARRLSSARDRADESQRGLMFAPYNGTGSPCAHGEGSSMIEIEGVSKRYGQKLALDQVSFSVHSGIVTGFLGPNGAGKSTMMRLILGLDRPTAGRASVDGRSFHEFASPLTEVGALLEARAIHPGRTAHSHLLALARTHGIGRRRVDEMIELVGLGEVARRRTGGFSLGMGQRLGIAAALLGDPHTLILDEPANGLDPEGIRWIRELMRGLAAEGRTIFVSSHLMSEMAQLADQLVVIGRGRLIADTTVDEFTRRASGEAVRVRSPQADRLATLLSEVGAAVTAADDGALDVQGRTAAEIGDLAALHGIALHELAIQQASLEEAFMRLTADAVEYHAGQPTAGVAA
jgi:ABC-2 type transport system ATP-binding protein